MKPPRPRWSYLRSLIEKQAYKSLEGEALDLARVAADQVAKLGSQASKTNRAIEIFGNIGQIDSGTSVTAASAKKGKPIAIGLARLVVDDVLSKLLKAVSMLFDVLIALGKSVLSVCTAHSLLVALLVGSVLYNSWHGYRDGLTWYHERSAGKFMARVGVTPNPAMSKSIYLSNIEDLIQTPTEVNKTVMEKMQSGDAKTCKTTFSELVTTSDSASVPLQRQGARLHRTRDSLARYRHDLLVALRVVNRIESDVVRAEWEEWVRAEEKKCARIEGMLIQQRTGKNKGKKSQAPAAEVDAELGEDFAEYCRSCRDQAAAISNGTYLL